MTLSLVLIALFGPAAPLGEEAFGNEAVPRHGEWVDGVLELANRTDRVYRRWVNGNEDFCYRGNAGAANAALGFFASVKDPKKEVVLLPDAGRTHSFERKLVAFDWRFHVPSGIYLHMAKGEKGTNAFPKHPTLFVHLAGKLEVKDLQVPRGLTVIGPDQLVARLRDALARGASTTVKGHACYRLRDFGYVPGVVDDLVAALSHEKQHVRLSALSALGGLGKDAARAVTTLRKLRDATTGREKGACKNALDRIAGAKAVGSPDPRLARLEGIRGFLKSR